MQHLQCTFVHSKKCKCLTTSLSAPEGKPLKSLAIQMDMAKIL